MADCFDKILKASRSSEVTRYKVMIKLMKDLENGLSDTLRVRNCLLLLVSLAFNQKYCDYTDNLGKSRAELSRSERTDLKNILKWEFMN